MKMNKGGLLDQKERRLRQKHRRQCKASERARGQVSAFGASYQKKIAACIHRGHSHHLRGLAITQLP
jgi:hypothetical protein